MMNSITKQDMRILKIFIENSIPSYIKERSTESWDLMECYEELFNYSHSLLCGHRIDVNLNSFRTGKAFVFDFEYKNILLNISNNSDDLNLVIHCYLSLAILAVLKKYDTGSTNF